MVELWLFSGSKLWSSQERLLATLDSNGKLDGYPASAPVAPCNKSCRCCSRAAQVSRAKRIKLLAREHKQQVELVRLPVPKQAGLCFAFHSKQRDWLAGWLGRAVIAQRAQQSTKRFGQKGRPISLGFFLFYWPSNSGQAGKQAGRPV